METKNYSQSLDFSIENFTGSNITEAIESLSIYESISVALETSSIVNWATDICKLGKILGAGFTIKQIIKGLVNYGLSVGCMTILSSIISCGKFNDGTEILKSPKCLNKIANFKNKYKHQLASLNDVKNDPAVRSKSGLLKYIFLGQTSGKKINELEAHDVAIRNVDGVTVSIVQLTPFIGSVDLKQLAGLRIIIVTAYYHDGNKLKSKNLCQGYIAKGAQVNKSGEELLNFIGY